MLLILSFRRSAIRTVAAAATNDITGGTLVRGQPAAGQSSRSVAMSSLSHMVTAAQAVTDCDSDYLKLDFVCDPSRLLSHTEAALLNRTIPEGFSYCSRNSGSFSTDSRGYNFGIVLLRSLYAPDLDRCRGARPSGTRPNMKAKNATVLLVLEQRLLQQKADLMRQLWNERLVHCSVDILVIMVQTVYFCIKNSMVVRPSKSRRLAIGVSLSQRLKSMVSEQDVVKDYQSFSDFTDVSGLIDGVTVKDILKLFRVLDVLLPSVSAVPPGDKPAASALPRHYIPENEIAVINCLRYLIVHDSVMFAFLNYFVVEKNKIDSRN
ncbi:unnamed protein product [Soboliphyme baturini]|uniref:Peroxisomal membrane protein PEX16 n=1 Tax=Soboliphyme baturini TaxID=241478 RepID=A0A183IY89_9BILA|nr:unnamed protein product [Soboliphyme baturini]